MSTQISLVGFTGSLREKSVNKGILRVVQELLPAHVTMEILTVGELPHYNLDLEADEPASVRNFKAKLRHADAILIVTPEFNGSVPGVLKNALDWASRPAGQSVMTGKLTAIAGAGGRGGTGSAQAHLRHILKRFGVVVLEQPEVMIANSREKFDHEGNLQDEASRAQLSALLSELLVAVQTQTTTTVS
ncbi:MAG: NADPH-dependent FMN reductase [Ktedonobacteraceae bacterium]